MHFRFMGTLFLLALLCACKAPVRIVHHVRGEWARIGVARPTGTTQGLTARIEVNNAMGSVVSIVDNSLNNRAEGFARAVEDAYPGHNVYGIFNEELCAALRTRGFQALDLALREESGEVVDSEGVHYRYPKVSILEADAVLIPVVDFGYGASSSLGSYIRRGTGFYLLVDLRTDRIVAREPLRFTSRDGRFEYYTYDKLLKDVVPATEALREAARSLAREAAATLD